ncbi:WAP four-disulfide core domain protein 1 [Camelus dromedarius]|uniref:WAP four-disulfide core domain protein 1 n=1 Tax=Camelus dromedarius TaxID=9838 RepID=A0A5N4DR02_CAMDR|nr:WAP four-disulfide core domain protein 1 [Camelus dromedarius]
MEILSGNGGDGWQGLQRRVLTRKYTCGSQLSGYILSWGWSIGRRQGHVRERDPEPTRPTPSPPRHRRCCYNGCAYACLEAVPPPPVLDWLVQPKPRWLGGNGWLLDGPEEVLQAEACSTTEDGAEPLLCPSGYECHILSPGDVAEGIPNRGQCVKQRRPAGEFGHPNPTYLSLEPPLGDLS